MKVRLAYGTDAGREVDIVELAAGRPSLLVVVNGSNRPAAGLTRCLMNFAEIHQKQLFAAVVYLADDPTEAEQYLKRGISWWGVGVPLGVSLDGPEGPGSYGLNRNVNLTILVADRGRVVRNIALVQPTPTDAPGILRHVVTLTGGRVPTEWEVVLLSAPTRKFGEVAWRGGPENVEFRSLFCDALSAKNKGDVRTSRSALEKYVGNDEERLAWLGNAAAIMLEGRGRAKIHDAPIVPALRHWQQQYDRHPRKVR